MIVLTNETSRVSYDSRYILKKNVKVILILGFRFTHLYYEQALTMIVFVNFTCKKIVEQMAGHKLSLIVHI